MEWKSHILEYLTLTKNMWNLCIGASNCASRQQYSILQYEVLQMKFNNENNNDKHPSLLSAVT